MSVYRVTPTELAPPPVAPTKRRRDRVLRSLGFLVALFPVLDMATSGHVSAGELGISALIVGILLT